MMEAKRNGLWAGLVPVVMLALAGCSPAETNADAGQAEKAAEAGVQSTPTGLHYKVIEEGSGTAPSAAATSDPQAHWSDRGAGP